MTHAAANGGEQGQESSAPDDRRLTDSTTHSERSSMSGARNEKANCPSTKIVIRRLPPSMTLETFVDQISPVPENDFLHFVKADMSLGQFAFSRAYINCINRDDIYVFKDKFDGYVFVDSKGAEYPAVVEFAPFPKVPKKKAKKLDTKCGTIEQDADYLKFLDNLNNPEEVILPNAEFYLEEIENREREQRANSGSRQFSTPLIEYLREKKAEKVRVREERREERRRREVEKKRQKEEERRRRKADREQQRERDRNNARDRSGRDGKQTGDKGGKSGATELTVKLLKNPERDLRQEDRDHEASPPITENDAPLDAAAAPRRDGGGGSVRQRVSTTVVKDWSAEVDRERSRRREDGRPRPDKQRDRKPKREQMDEGERHQQQRSHNSRPMMQEGTAAAAPTVDRSKTSGPTRPASEWHRGTHHRTVVASGASAGRSGKGKSYEKSRQECLASKAKSDLGRGSGAVNRKKTPSESCADPDGGAGKGDAKCDAEVESGFRRERSSRDPRTERRIRNKDRPSIELYRPGMRRVSQPRVGSSSSSPTSPTTEHAPDPKDNDDGHSDKEGGKFGMAHVNDDDDQRG